MDKMAFPKFLSRFLKCFVKFLCRCLKFGTLQIRPPPKPNEIEEPTKKYQITDVPKESQITEVPKKIKKTMVILDEAPLWHKLDVPKEPQETKVHKKTKETFVTFDETAMWYKLEGENKKKVTAPTTFITHEKQRITFIPKNPPQDTSSDLARAREIGDFAREVSERYNYERRMNKKHLHREDARRLM